MKYELSKELLQKILDFICTSSNNMQVNKIIQLVDEIRALKPVKEAQDLKSTDIEKKGNT